jgi:hypothetical protein
MVKKQKKSVNANSNSSNLKGIGGWLLFFVILLCLNVITGFFGVISFFMIEFQNSLLFAPLTVISWILSILVLVLILRKSKNTRKLTITALSISILLSVLAIIFAITTLSGFGDSMSDATFSTLLSIIIRSPIGIVFSILWIVYFIKSRRVKNTFGN